MRFLLLAVFVFFIYACDTSPDRKPEERGSDPSMVIRDTILSESSLLLEKDIMAAWINDPCSQQEEYEFHSLYDPQPEIKADQEENLILSDSLIAHGFVRTNWGRGNWMEGPRIVSHTLTKGDCICEVHKLYYSPGLDSLMKVTERIRRVVK